MSTTQDFLFEIGVEEMPSAPLIHAEKQFKDLAQAQLTQKGLTYDRLEVFSTPRRLALLVHGLVDATEEIHEVKRGPLTSIAYDAEGRLTPAGRGFAKKAGVEPEALTVVEHDGKAYVSAERVIPALHTVDLLPEFCLNLIRLLEWPNYRSQRWGSERETFVRPIRWLVARFGKTTLDVRYADVNSADFTYGHRVLAPGAHTIEEPSEYCALLKSLYVLDAQARRESIIAQVKAYESEHPGVQVHMPEKILSEVVNLCEWPTVMVGTFDEDFLKVPHEIICESMLSHQRYFPIYKEGNLTQQFVVVSNANPESSVRVIDGNERVVRARLRDAQFFYEEDLKVSLDVHAEKLSRVVFQEQLGTMQAKVERISKLASKIAELCFHMDAEDVLRATRAAQLAKADLTTQSVVEFTSQQGIMGGYFCRAQGEDPEVARAVEEHYRPRFAGDDIPSTSLGCCVSLADKLDTVSALFAIGQPPTGSSDPFALRRSAIGMLAMLREVAGTDFAGCIRFALQLLADQGIVFDAETAYQNVVTFLQGRMQTVCKDAGFAPDFVEAVLSRDSVEIHDVFSKLATMREVFANGSIGSDALAAFVRVSALADVQLGTECNEGLFIVEEQALYQKTVEAKKTLQKLLSEKAYEKAFVTLAGLKPSVDRFFDAVMVMDPDTSVRENRIKLLNNVLHVFDMVVDMRSLSARK